MSISTNIKLRRLQLGLTQQQLAEMVGYQSRSAIAKIESGASELPVTKLLAFSRALDTTAERLLEGTDAEQGVRGRRNGRLVGRGSEQRVAVVILAGGKSTRNLQNIPNQFINVLGKPIIGYCMEAYERHPLISDILVVCADGYSDVLFAYADRFGISKLADVLPAGQTGVLSAKAGFDEAVRRGLGPRDIVVFQESTRPFITEETITKLLGVTRETGSAIVGEPMADRVQFIQGDGGQVQYLDRNRVMDLQSPDAHTISFAGSVFTRAEQVGHDMSETNFSMLMYNLGFPMNFCRGAQNNLKIVRQEDIVVATALLRQRV